MAEDNPGSWSNTKRARIFMHLLGCLALEHGEDGVLRVPTKSIDKAMRVGFATDGDDFLIVVDMDVVT